MDNEILRVLVSGSDVNGDNANTDFTSDEICMLNAPWSLVFTFSSLSVTGKYPTLEIQGSNDVDAGANTWDTIPNGSAASLPRTFESSKCRYRYLRLVYLSNGATAGTINCYMIQKK